MKTQKVKKLISKIDEVLAAEGIYRAPDGLREKLIHYKLNLNAKYFNDGEDVSTCCGAPFYPETDICTACKEHG